MEKLLEVLKQHDVTPEELLEWLGSKSVHIVLRKAYKSPLSCGLDDIDLDTYNYDLYELCAKIRTFNQQ
jgi:hypothetical protein